MTTEELNIIESEDKEKRVRAFMIKAQKDYPDSENYDEDIPCAWEEEEMEIVKNKKSKTLIIPESMTHIGNNAFCCCQYLFNAVSIPASINSIGDYAFAATTLEGELIIPEGVESIGTYAFGGTSLNSVRLPNSLISIGDNVFESTNVEEIIVPKGTKDRFKKLFEGQEGGIDKYTYKKVDLSTKIVEK